MSLLYISKGDIGAPRRWRLAQESQQHMEELGLPHSKPLLSVTNCQPPGCCHALPASQSPPRKKAHQPCSQKQTLWVDNMAAVLGARRGTMSPAVTETHAPVSPLSGSPARKGRGQEPAPPDNQEAPRAAALGQAPAQRCCHLALGGQVSEPAVLPLVPQGVRPPPRAPTTSPVDLFAQYCPWRP